MGGIALHDREPFDVLILDLMLPDIDGLDVCRRIRDKSETPILMLTARGDAMDRVVGLEMGADDYLPKPFEPRELLARLRALLRRAKSEHKADVLRFGRLEIDTGARQIRLDGEERALTSLSVRAAAGAGAKRRPRAVARRADEPVEERAAGSVRPLDRRACLAHPRRDRGRSEKAEARHHRARRGLCVRESAGLAHDCTDDSREV